jgi:phosphatidate phosphatase PAH1
LFEDHIKESKEYQIKHEEENSQSETEEEEGESDDRLEMLLERRRVDINRRSFAQGRKTEVPRKNSQKQGICISGILSFYLM